MQCGILLRYSLGFDLGIYTNFISEKINSSKLYVRAIYFFFKKKGQKKVAPKAMSTVSFQSSRK